ncbi:hypothetical protein FQR65_LT03258 [Abscondita terminalis]|nr:hypothetical protein FQR65_LT03258 [Abscondita terminalis]
MNESLVVFLTILGVYGTTVNSVNILGVFLFPSISHQVVFQPIWKELSLRGHKLTVLTPNPLKDSLLTNLTEIDLSFAYDIVKKTRMQDSINKDCAMTDIIRNVHKLLSSLVEAELKYDLVQALLRDESQKFDLVIVEYLHPTFTALSAKYKCPLIGISSLNTFITGHDALGNPSHPVLNPDLLLPFSRASTFYDRLYSVFFSIWIRYEYYYNLLPEQDKVARKYISNNIPYLGDIEKNMSLLFLNVNPILHGIRPNVPAVIELGKIHLQNPKPLPKDLQQYLDEATVGVVYFSLGSNIRCANLSFELTEKITRALSQLPYKVLWKWEDERLPNRPNNVITKKWFPQQDILRHPNVKVFLTQGGLQSMEESINCGVPLVGMPFFGDQPVNVAKMVNLGIAKQVDFATLNVQRLKDTIIEVAENPKFRNRVKEIASLTSDVPMAGLEKAVWWIDLCSISVHSVNILGVFFVPSISHQTVFQPIWKELSLRGHKLTVLTPNPLNDSSLTNLTEIDLSFTYDIIKKANLQVLIHKDRAMTDITRDLFKIFSTIVEAQLKYEPVQALLRDESKTFDLVIVEYLNPTFTALSAKYKCPLIGITSLGTFTPGHDAVGNPSHPVLNPDTLLPFTRALTFYDRLYSVFFSTWIRYEYHYNLMPEQDKVARKYISNNIPYLGDIERNMSLLFLNVNPIIHDIRPNVPAVIALGKMHLQNPKPLPKDLQQYLDEATEGVVYFSLGTNIRCSNLSLEIKEKITQALTQLPYKVLLKWEENNLPNQPKNVIVKEWFPQQDVLRHPNVKVFVTQGGLQSVEESINAEVPLVGMPFFGDQPWNIAKMVNLGIAKQVNSATFDAQTLKETITEVAQSPKFRNRVKEIASIASDVPMTGLEKAVWWVEYVIRHKGAKHLKSPAVDLPLYQYYLLDIFGFIFIIFTTGIFIISKVVRFVVSSNSAKTKLKNN